MCQSRYLLFLATLALLNHLSLARVIPVSGPARCLSQSRNLLKTTDDMVKTAREKLKHYSCTAEDIDHEDITRDQTSTLKTCLPLELHKSLNHNGETLRQKPPVGEADPYRVKMKLCILLHAFSTRVVTINRVMGYLSSA